MTQRKLDDVDYYALLGVEHDADHDSIKSAFHSFARRYHPDGHADNDAEHTRRTRIYQRGTEAYRVLSHPEQRRIYDAGLVAGRLRFDSSQVRSTLRPSTAPGRATGKALQFLAKADQALGAGDLAQAKLNLRIALQHEPGNAEIEARLAKLEQGEPQRR